MAHPFSVTIDNQPSCVVAAFKGLATTSTADLFEGEVDRLIDMKPSLVVLDLSGLEFMSSFGLGAFLNLLADVKTRGGAVRVAAPTKNILGLLQATKVIEMMPVFPTVEAAVKG